MVGGLACRGALVFVLAPALVAPAHGQTREHPLVVAGERVPLAELEAQAVDSWLWDANLRDGELDARPRRDAVTVALAAHRVAAADRARRAQVGR